MQEQSFRSAVDSGPATAAESSRLADCAGVSIVERAAAILEEELAAPLLESLALSPVGGSPTGSQGESGGVLRQSGRQAQGLRDVLLRLLASGNTSRGPAASGGRPSREVQSPDVDDPVFRATARARPGQVIELTIGLVNDDPNKMAQVQLFCADLLAGPDLRIRRGRVTLLPSTLELQPGESADVVMRVDVPPNAARGPYAGLLQATDLDGLQAIVTVRVQ